MMLMIPQGLQVEKALLPAAYNGAKQALAACQKIDECKDWSDKAQALASYAKQADDDDLEKMALRIKSRAVRRAGELLKAFQTPHGVGRPKKNGPYGVAISQRQAAEDAGMSKRQEEKARRVAEVPDNEFEAAVESDKPPTISALVAKKTEAGDDDPMRSFAPPVGFQEATRLTGHLRKLADFCEKNQPKYVLGGFLPHEIEDARQHAETIRDWLDLFLE